jgi:hypothetical protein
MDSAEPEPFFVMNNAPDLPHFGKRFELHGPSGVLVFRIDMQNYTHDGLVMIGGVVLHGTETYETGHSQDCTGQPMTAFVTESQYMRLSNALLE